MKIIVQLLTTFIPMLFGMLTKEQGKQFVDGLLDYLERWIVASDNKIDDVVGLAFINKFREVFDIPDFPDEE
jgi:hypothetical protein